MAEPHGDRAGDDAAVLLTGATGFLGGLAAVALLRHTRARLVLPVRGSRSPAEVLDRLGRLLAAEAGPAGEPPPAALFDRARVVPLPPPAQLPDLAPELRSLGVREVLHCAGSVEYFDKSVLDAANVELTRGLLDLGAALSIRRFTFLSTAFSSGYTGNLIAERPHPDPASDPTEYTRSKRRAERLVLASGLPALILRPSVVIGASRTGRYGGPPYGLYQAWEAFARFLCDAYRPRIHAVANAARMHLLHLDHFQEALLACYGHVPAGIVHLVSGEETLPRVEDVVFMWRERVLGDVEVITYPKLADVPMDALSKRERTFLEFTAVNHEIASAGWSFERTTLEALFRDGRLARLPEANVESVGRCQDAFAAASERVRRYRAALAGAGAALAAR